MLEDKDDGHYVRSRADVDSERTRSDLELLLEEEVGSFRQPLSLEQKCNMSIAISLRRLADHFDPKD